MIRLVEAVGVQQLRETLVGSQRLSDLQFPDHPEFVAKGVLAERLERDHVLQAGDRLVGRGAGEALLLHVRDGPR